MEPITAAQIHKDFYKDLCKKTELTVSQSKMLSDIGYDGVAPEKYRTAFPLHKIISYNRIIKLCEKWGLVFGNVKRYVGDLPHKNILEIENFMLSYPYYHIRTNPSIFSGGKDFELVHKNNLGSYRPHEAKTVFDFKICAPPHMMISDSDIRKVDLEITDPIIIGMITESYGYWQTQWGVIVTAWGDEASDESV